MRAGRGTAEKRLGEVQRRFERWRRGRRRKSGRIPIELWELAADAATVCSVEETASQLELDPARLRQWLGDGVPEREKKGREKKRCQEPMFVMLLGPSDMLVRWESQSGQRVEI
jgi:hypothetical protein